MEIEVRKMTIEDMEQALDVEKSAIKGPLHYLRDAFDYYTSTKGELSVACIDNKVVGVGKFSILFDGSAWLEVLRVHEDYQKQGVGTAIYRRYMEQFNDYSCQRIGLYTGKTNIGSYKLAQRHGLSEDTYYTSFSTTSIKEYQVVPFKLLTDIPTQKISTPHLNIQHVFYSVNEANLRGFLAQGYLYQYEDTLLVMGSRFQPDQTLFIASIEGSYVEEAIKFALNMAYLRGVHKVIYHTPSKEMKHQDLFINYGFIQDSGEDLVMSLVKE